MILKQSVNTSLKGKLSNTLKTYLPYLQVPLTDLEEMVQEFKQDNPMVEIKESGFKDRAKNRELFEGRKTRNSNMEAIEKLTINKDSLFDKLYDQISSSIFPTDLSIQIAHLIIGDIDECGYFTGDLEEIAQKCSTDVSMVNGVRKRFSSLEPTGVGSLNLKESYMFQLDSLADVSDEAYTTCSTLIENLDKIHSYKKTPFYTQATTLIKHFNNPPAIDYLSDDIFIIPDLIININDNNDIEVSLNNDYYPTIGIDTTGIEEDKEHSFLKEQIKNANNLISAIDMRKATLRKVGNMILEHQFDFFFYGNEIKPMKLADIAKDLEYNPSTISRAISNKYIECNQGIIPIKSFFTTSLDSESETSSTAIKNFIKDLVSKEDKDKPLSDVKILAKIEKKFKVKIVRRTITKYRQSMNIGSSSDRKKYI
jgi:RNA polymerase sigma-54 factor